ncbi:MAG: DNA translocase FtsK 4TM domain-containing protein, partial [Burkholderiaceae bacterium]
MSLFKRSKAPEPAKPRRVSARRKAGVGTSQAVGAAEVFAADVAWILWLSATAFLAAAFASFSPNDGGWFAVSTQVVPQNWFGRAGAVVADLFFFLFGVSAVWWLVL